MTLFSQSDIIVATEGVQAEIIATQKQRIKERVAKITLDLQQADNQKIQITRIASQLLSDNPEGWAQISPGATAYDLISEIIPHLMQDFFKSELHSFGFTVYHPKTLDELDQDHRVKAGWYIFEKESFKPVMEGGKFSHFYVEKHGPTELGKNILEIMACILGYRGVREYREAHPTFIEQMIKAQEEKRPSSDT